MRNRIAPTLTRLVMPGVMLPAGSGALMDAQAELRALLAVARAARSFHGHAVNVDVPCSDRCVQGVRLVNALDRLDKVSK